MERILTNGKDIARIRKENGRKKEKEGLYDAVRNEGKKKGIGIFL